MLQTPLETFSWKNHKHEIPKLIKLTYSSIYTVVTNVHHLNFVKYTMYQYTLYQCTFGINYLLTYMDFTWNISPNKGVIYTE